MMTAPHTTTYDARLTNNKGQALLFLKDNQVINTRGQVLGNFQDQRLQNLLDQTIARIEGNQILSLKGQVLGWVENGALYNWAKQPLLLVDGATEEDQVKVAAFFFFM